MVNRVKYIVSAQDIEEGEIFLKHWESTNVCNVKLIDD